MLDLSEVFSRLGRLATFPWRGVLLALGLAFLLASVLTSLVGELLIPDFSHRTEVRNTGDVAALRFAERPSLDRRAVDKIIKRNIFNIEGKTGEEDAKVAEAGVPGGVPVKTTLPLVLIGVIYGGDPYSGLAVIKNSSKNVQNSFFVGDDLLADARIIEINQDRVIIQRAKNREYLAMEIKPLEVKRRKKDPQAIKDAAAGLASTSKTSQSIPPTYKEEGFERDGTQIVLSTDFRQKLLTSDFAKVLQDAKAEPNMVGNELNGFRLHKIRPDSIYEKAGLVEGDVVKEINGVSLIDTGQAIKLLNSLRNEAEVEIRIDRGGSPLTLSMKVK